MIKVVKHGYKGYSTVCYKCGCEFTYELEDIKEGYVSCPDCNEKSLHNYSLNVRVTTRLKDSSEVK